MAILRQIAALLNLVAWSQEVKGKKKVQFYASSNPHALLVPFKSMKGDLNTIHGFIWSSQQAPPYLAFEEFHQLFLSVTYQYEGVFGNHLYYKQSFLITDISQYLGFKSTWKELEGDPYVWGKATWCGHSQNKGLG